jgi:hypothetical protein
MFSDNRIWKKKTFYGVKNLHLRNLMELLKEFLFIHDFQKAGQVLIVILSHPKYMREIIVKVSHHQTDLSKIRVIDFDFVC